MKLDLTDAELDELDDLLAATPAPLEPLDVAMLDGLLCGVIVQPATVAADAWLPLAFDVRGRPLPPDADERWLARTRALLLRRHEALARALEEDGFFVPVLPGDAADSDDAALRDTVREMPAHSRALVPWALGFQVACARFPALVEAGDPAIDAALARVFRHLPAPTPEARAAFAEMDRAAPLASEEEAVDDLVLAVSELWELTQDRRLAVPTVRRATPKVGRNDPCPCGSGRKFKHCHGA